MMLAIQINASSTPFAIGKSESVGGNFNHLATTNDNETSTSSLSSLFSAEQCALNFLVHLNRSFFSEKLALEFSESELNETVVKDSLLQFTFYGGTIDDGRQMITFVCGNTIQHAWYLQLIYVSMFVLIVLLAAGGNLTVIWIVLWHRKMRTVTNYFLLNLALADTSISIFNVCFSFTQNFYNQWWFGSNYCAFNNFIGVAPTCASVFTLMAMSIDRWWAITHPFGRRLSRTSVIIIISLIWLSAALCGLPMLLYSYHLIVVYESGLLQYYCRDDNYPDGVGGSLQFRIYNQFLSIVTYVVPLFVLAVCYSKVGLVLWGSHNIIGEHVQMESIHAKKRVVKTMFIVVLVFMICWLPYHTYFAFLRNKLNDLIQDSQIVLYIYLNIYWLAMASTVANPIIYCWLNKKFLIGFKYAFRWLPWINITYEDYSQSELCRQDGRKSGIICESSSCIRMNNTTPTATATVLARRTRASMSCYGSDKNLHNISPAKKNSVVMISSAQMNSRRSISSCNARTISFSHNDVDFLTECRQKLMLQNAKSTSPTNSRSTTESRDCCNHSGKLIEKEQYLTENNVEVGERCSSSVVDCDSSSLTAVPLSPPAALNDSREVFDTEKCLVRKELIVVADGKPASKIIQRLSYRCDL